MKKSTHSSIKVKVLAPWLLSLVLVAWQLLSYGGHLEQHRSSMEGWLGGILFGELIGWIITNRKPGEVAPSKTGLLLFAEFFLILAMGSALFHLDSTAPFLGIAAPFVNLALGRKLKTSLAIVLVVAVVAFLAENNLWFLPLSILLYYMLHLGLVLKPFLKNSRRA